MIIWQCLLRHFYLSGKTAHVSIFFLCMLKFSLYSIRFIKHNFGITLNKTCIHGTAVCEQTMVRVCDGGSIFLYDPQYQASGKGTLILAVNVFHEQGSNE